MGMSILHYSANESDEVIKSVLRTLVPIPSEFEGIFDDSCDVLNCDNNRVNIESDFVEYLVNRDTSIDNSSKIDPIFERSPVKLASYCSIYHPRIVDAICFNDDTSSDDEDLRTCDSSITSLSHLDNSLPEFESFSDHSEETRSGSTTTHANYSLPMINNLDVLNNDEPFDQGGGENVVFLNDEEDDSFTFTIRTFLPFVTYPEVTLLSCSTGSEDTIFDPGISI
ncbi:hypothetical protein Tco_0534772 [Tanacetum coccineum]